MSWPLGLPTKRSDGDRCDDMPATIAPVPTPPPPIQQPTHTPDHVPTSKP